MGAVATDEQRALAWEVVEAWALIEAGGYDEALDLLESAQEQAQARGDGEALGEVGRLARAVWRRARRGSAATERANRLALAIHRDAVGARVGEVGSVPPTWYAAGRESRRAPPLAVIVGLVSLLLLGWLIYRLTHPEFDSWDYDPMIVLVL